MDGRNSIKIFQQSIQSLGHDYIQSKID